MERIGDQSARRALAGYTAAARCAGAIVDASDTIDRPHGAGWSSTAWRIVQGESLQLETAVFHSEDRLGGNFIGHNLLQHIRFAVDGSANEFFFGPVSRLERRKPMISSQVFGGQAAKQ